MGLMDAAVGVAERLIPPGDGDRHVFKWRLAVAGLTIMNAGGLLVHILLACGYLPFYAGFAKAGEMKDMKTQMAADAQAIKVQVQDQAATMQRQLASFEDEQKKRRVSTLKSEILNLQAKRCAAPAGPARQLYLVSIQEGLVEYNQLTGQIYPLPGCDSF